MNWYELAGLDAQEFSAGGIRTFAIVEGRSSAFPVILLHGIPGASFIWEAVIKAVGRERRVIAPDLPGWGRSQSKYEKPFLYSRANLVQWLRDVRDAQGIERFDLVAHSDAGWLAAEFLVHEPQRVRRLGFMNPNFDKAASTGWLARIWQRSKWSDARLQKWLGQESGLTTAARERYRPLFNEMIKATAASPELPEKEFAERFADYKTAIRDYRGAKLIIANQESDLADKSDVTVLANAGYYPMLSEPKAVAELVAEFLRD